MEAKTKKVEKKSEIDLFIGKEIAKFDFAKTYFTKIKKKFSGLVITDINDKEGYEAVRKALAETRSTKSTIEKKRKEIKENSLKFGRAVDAEAARLVDLVLPIHQELQAKKDVIDKEKAKLKEEKKAEKAKVVTLRSIQLMDNGLEFDGLRYFYGEHEISVAELAVYNDANFEAFLAEVEEKIKSDQEAKKAQDDLELLIHSRISQLKDEDLEQFILPVEKTMFNYGSMTNEDFVELVQKLKNRAAEVSKKKKLNDSRYKQIAPVLQFSDVAIDVTKLHEMQEVQFLDLLDDLNAKKQVRKDEDAAAEKLRKENEAVAKDLADRAAVLQKKEDEAAEKEQKRLDAIQAKKDEAAREKAAADLKPDMEKIKAYITAINDVVIPKCKTTKGKETVKNITADLDALTRGYLNLIK